MASDVVIDGATIDLEAANAEFARLKTQATQRNYEYYLLRQAVRGNFRWPSNWPTHIEKVKHNLCKSITERFVTYLLGKGFSWNIDRPNSVEWREAAESSEKILRRLLRLSDADLQFDMGGKTGSQLGRTVFKVYKKGEKGREHACFSFCQPDYFYGIPAGDNMLGEYAKVYYSYPIDVLEARRLFGNQNFKTEGELQRGNFYDPLKEKQTADSLIWTQRNVPVLEVWTKEAYALVVGGVTIFNGKNPNTWTDTGEGYIPFVIIENLRASGDGVGEADITQARELNERLNWTISRKMHIVSRWLQPTLVWEGAPTNYADILTATIGGGGAIPARLGSRLYFLAYDKPNPAVGEMEATLRQAILESAGMNEIALQGTLDGSINTGPTVAAQYQPVISTVEKKRNEWSVGLRKLFAMLLNEQERIGDSDVLGMAVINADPDQKSAVVQSGTEKRLSGKDIKGLRDVTLSWPGVLPKDDTEAARLEMEKASQGLQSIYTTLEKLGEEYPFDELARVRSENEDSALRGSHVAEQMRATAPLVSANASAAQTMAELGQVPPEGEEPTPTDEELAANGDLGARLRALARNAKPALDESGDEPLITAGAPEGY